VERCARADDVHDPHQGAPARGALDVHDLVVAAHREVDRLADLRVQLAHERQRMLAHADAGLHQVAELQQAHPEPVAALLDALDHAVAHECGEDAVRGGRVQPRLAGEDLQADRVRGVGQDVEQLHHPLDDLDGVLGFLVAHGGVGLPICRWAKVYTAIRKPRRAGAQSPVLSFARPRRTRRTQCASACSSPVSST
jgi:hypothetical protein